MTSPYDPKLLAPLLERMTAQVAALSDDFTPAQKAQLETMHALVELAKLAAVAQEALEAGDLDRASAIFADVALRARLLNVPDLGPPPHAA